MNLQTLDASASPEVQVNENFETIDYASVYGKRQPTTSALTWGYTAGRWSGFAVAAGTLTLTDNSDNYVVAHRSDGAISTSTASTNWNDTGNYARVYKLTTLSGVVTVTEDHRAGAYGVHGSAQAVINFVDLETPTGLINGSNVTYTLAHAPSPAASCIGYVRQGGAGAFFPCIYGIDFTLSGLTVTMTAAPDSGSNLYFSYRY